MGYEAEMQKQITERWKMDISLFRKKVEFQE